MFNLCASKRSKGDAPMKQNINMQVIMLFKKVLSIFFVVLILMGLVGCSSSNKQQIKSEDNNSQRESEKSESTRKYANLNLPLIAKENTFYDGEDSYCRISEEGTLEQMYHYMHTDYYFSQAGAGLEWNPLAFEVRDFALYDYLQNGRYSLMFLISRNNKLWATGFNDNGVLGDGTGVDSRDEPVFVLDDVAKVGRIETNGFTACYAIKTDKSLWIWGDGENYAPIKVADDVIKVASYGNRSFILKSSGLLYEFDTMELAKEFPVYDFQYGWYIDMNGALYNNQNECVASSNVIRIFVAEDSTNAHFIKSDNSLWGWGDNQFGQLGDGTKLPFRDESVKIADDVAEVFGSGNALWGGSGYLKLNGELWCWDSNIPTPKKYFDGVASILYSNENTTPRYHCAFLNSGDMLLFRIDAEDDPNSLIVTTVDNVKTPRVIVY